MIKLATWNVNSIKVRLPQVIDWLEREKVDALVMQETKTVDELFPREAFNAAGFECLFCGQKTYNGVALVTRKSAWSSVQNPVLNLPNYPDEQKRFIAADLTHVSGRRLAFAGAYFPNGQEVGCDKFFYKLDWIGALTRYMRSRIKAGEEIVLGGDFNIAPSPEDVWDPVAWKDTILVSEAERGAWRVLLGAGLIDTWTLGLHAPETYSWWDYRQAGFEKNHGLRIDHLLATPKTAAAVSQVWIDTAPRALEKPSDHAPVVMTLEA